MTKSDVTSQLKKELATQRQELRKAQEKCQRNEGVLRFLLDSCPDAIVAIDLEGTVTECNQAVLDILGYKSREDILRTSAAQLLVPEERARLSEGISSVLTNLNGRITEHAVLSTTGERIPVELFTRISRDTQGQPNSIVVAFKDLRERIQAEHTLLLQQQYFQSLIENSASVYTVLNVDANIVYMSASVERVYGWLPEELIGHNFLEMFHSEDVDAILWIFNELVETPGLVRVLEARYQHRDGSWRSIEISGVNLLNDPAVKGFVITSHDVTERKQAADELLRSENKYRSILENTSDAYWHASIDGVITDINPSGIRMLGCQSKEELIGINVFETMMNFEQAMSWVSDMTAGPAEEESRLGNREINLISKDGEHLIWDASFRLIRDESEAIVAIEGFGRDISERRRAEEDLARVKKEKDAQIVQSAKLANLGEMATGIAHEINQPLNVIKIATTGMLGFIERGKNISMDMLKEELEDLDKQIERMRLIIDHLRTFARRSSEAHHERVDMNIPLDDCFKMVRQQLRLREVDIQMDQQELPVVLADSNRLEQVFLNIVTNARDAMDELAERSGRRRHKKILEIRSFVENSNAVVTISDTGGGIPKNDRERIFEPFYTTKEVGKGTGLGLSISYSIIKEFNGVLEFSVEECIGTTFKISLPIAPADEAPPLPGVKSS